MKSKKLSDLLKPTISLIIVLALLGTIMPAQILAINTDDDEQVGSAPTLEDFLAGNASAEDIYGILDETTVPEIIGYEEAVSKNHVLRLYEDEGDELNKVIFLNVDGSKTMYMFDFPVKYIADDGSINDITLEITDSATQVGEFTSVNNSTITTFSAQFTNGITLEGQNAFGQLPLQVAVVA